MALYVDRRQLLLAGMAGLLTPAIAAACGGAAATPAPVGGTPGGFDGTLLFGAPLSLTGSTAKEGGLTRDGYELWKETYNAAGGIRAGSKRYRIETKYYDDESNAQKSATLAEKLINEDKVNFLLGPYGTSATLQVSTVAEKNKIPMIEGNGAAESIFEQGYQYTFGVLSPARNYLRGVIDLALALQGQREVRRRVEVETPREGEGLIRAARGAGGDQDDGRAPVVPALLDLGARPFGRAGAAQRGAGGHPRAVARPQPGRRHREAAVRLAHVARLAPEERDRTAQRTQLRLLAGDIPAAIHPLLGGACVRDEAHVRLHLDGGVVDSARAPERLPGLPVHVGDRQGGHVAG